MKTENILLILGLIFSIVLITFRIENGFEFLNIQSEFSIIDVAFYKSNETYLSSIIIGYLFYLIFSLIMMRKINRNEKKGLLFFSLLSLIGISFELKVFYENLNGMNNGAHLRIGIPLALIGFFISNRMNSTKLNKKTTANNS